MPPESVRKSLALAAAHGIGPFRRRVSIAAEPYEPEEAYTDFTIDVIAPKPIWKYEGTLPDSAVTQIVTTRPKLTTLYLKHFTEAASAPSLRTQFTNILSNSIKPKLLTEAFSDPYQAKYTAGFEFNRNGMHYVMTFYRPNSDYDPVTKFTISPRHDSSILSAREMTRAEAEYGLEILEAELSEADKAFFQWGISRLKDNLPTRTAPGVSLFIEELQKWKTADSEKDYFDIPHEKDAGYSGKYYVSMP